MTLYCPHKPKNSGNKFIAHKHTSSAGWSFLVNFKIFLTNENTNCQRVLYLTRIIFNI